MHRHVKTRTHYKEAGTRKSMDYMEPHKVIETLMPGDSSSILQLKARGGTPENHRILVKWFGCSSKGAWNYAEGFPLNINCFYGIPDSVDLLVDGLTPGSVRGFIFSITARDTEENPVSITYPSMMRGRPTIQPIEMRRPISPPMLQAYFTSLSLKPPFDRCYLQVNLFALINTSEDRILVATLTSPPITLRKKAPKPDFAFSGGRITCQGHCYEKDIAQYISVAERGTSSRYPHSWWQAQCIFRGLEANDTTKSLAKRLRGHEEDPMETKLFELEQKYRIDAVVQGRQGLEGSRHTAKRLRRDSNGNAP
jgi:hypothetical protein